MIYKKSILLIVSYSLVILMAGCSSDKKTEEKINAPSIPEGCLKVYGVVNEDTKEVGTVGYTCKDKNGEIIYTEIVPKS